MNFPYRSKADLQSPRLIQLYEYWNALKGPRFAPALREIDPRAIPGLLPWLWLADVVDQGTDFGFRLGGERIIEYVGKRLSGARLSALQGLPFFEAMRETFDLCVRTKQAIIRGPVADEPEDSLGIDIKVLLLPLSTDGENVTQLIGGLEFPRLDQRQSA